MTLFLNQNHLHRVYHHQVEAEDQSIEATSINFVKINHVQKVITLKQNISFILFRFDHYKVSSAIKNIV